MSADATGSNRDYWKNFWNTHAATDRMYGRDTWSFREFYLLITDVVMALDLNKDDVLLDAGGGTGAMAIALAPFVKRITLFDFGDDIVAKAREETSFFRNIDVLSDDVRVFGSLAGAGAYSKVLVGSVLQYLDDMDEVRQVLAQTFRVLASGGRALYTHNPDLAKKAAHIESYGRLSWEKERVDRALEMEERRLWVDKEEFYRISREVGFGKSVECAINGNLWQSTHMFDWLVEK